MSDEELPPIDAAAYAALEDVADGDAEFMSELLGQYLQDAEVLVGALAPALESQDSEALERAAHTLRSASANVGGMVLSNLCQELRCIGRSGKLDDAIERVPRANAEYARLKKALQHRLDKLAGQA